MDITFEMLKEAMLLRGWQYKEQLPPYAKGEMPYMFYRSMPYEDCTNVCYAECWASNDMINWFYNRDACASTYREHSTNIYEFYNRILEERLHWHVTYPSHYLGGNAVILATTKEDAIKCTCEGLNLANDIGMDAKVISLPLNKPVAIFNGD